MNKAAPTTQDTVRHLPWLLFTIVLAVAPFWVVSFPPATDLPQHLDQIVLAEQLLAGQRPEMVFSPWFTPNTLVYALVWVAMALAEPVVAGKIVISCLMAAWIAASHYLAWRLQRPMANWLLTCVIAYNFLFYWGLLNFLIGWPVFCLFLAAVCDERDQGSGKFRPYLITSTLFVLLYFSHALWFLCANGVLIAMAIGCDWRRFAPRLAAALPAWILAAFWYPQLAASRSASGVDVGMYWDRMPLARAQLNEFADALLGGLQNPVESLLAAALVGWAVLALLHNRHALERQVHKPLFVCGCAMVLAWWILPDRYMNTIFFSDRWLPGGMVILLISLPQPRIPQRTAFLASGILLCIISLITYSHWRAHDQEELDGLKESLAMISSEDRVLGLDYVGGSDHVKGRPFLQLFAYSQALHGNDVQFSFAEHYSGIVSYRGIREVPWKRSLLWKPGTVARSDTQHFDKVLIGGPPEQQAFWASRLALEPLGPEGATTWRLYRAVRSNLGTSLP